MFFFFFNATATTEIYTLSLHVALPIWNQRAIHDSMVRISELENRGDALYATVIADLFRGHGREPVEIMKWKEVFDRLEDACDACKDFTHVIGNIVTKNA